MAALCLFSNSTSYTKCPIYLDAGVGSDEWAAEARAAPSAPQGATQLLDSILHVELHDFCHRFLADGVWQILCLCKQLYEQ